MNDLKDIADHAAHQDYQWMFVAMFTILMVVVVGNGIVMSEAKNVIAQAAKILERVEKKL